MPICSFISRDIDYLDLKTDPVNTSIFYTKHPAYSTKFNFPYVVNIYFADELTDGSSTPTGSASFPLSGNRIIFIRNSNALTTTLAHEVGHYFGLYHTFGKNNNCTRQDELVTGSNCDYSGDDVCDTPASPCLGLTGEVDVATCTYIGTRLDPLGQPYNPMVNNIMDYGPGSCQSTFTDGQIARMQYFLTHVYADLNCIQNFDSYCDAHALSSYKAGSKVFNWAIKYAPRATTEVIISIRVLLHRSGQVRPTTCSFKTKALAWAPE
ncbi:MAG: hypothetical protein IPH31_21600 [Lewinellaceae bacterium]|nr:hypothetical protein [Lewinellaceae bacterium]